MSPTRKGSSTVPVLEEVPRSLRQVIVKIMAEKDLDWPQACEEAAVLIDANTKEFHNRVKLEAERTYNRRFMKQLNEARKKVYNEGYKKGYNDGVKYVRENEDNFRVPCSVCHKPTYFSSLHSNWDDMKAVLYEAFKKWGHSDCIK